MEAETMASEKETSKELLDRECDTLLSEISRLEMVRDMQNKRVKNAMNWVSSWLIQLFGYDWCGVA